MTDWVSKIVHALGGKSHGGGSSAMCFCPAHKNKKTPALSVSVRDGKLLVKCHGPCSQSVVIAALKQRGLWPQSQKKRQDQPRVSEGERTTAIEEELESAQQEAWRILRVARDNNKLTLVRRYLGGRQLKRVPRTVRALTAAQSHRLLNVNFPAMVVPIFKPNVGVQGVQVTHLSRDGETKLNADAPRKIHGKLKGGYVIVSKIDRDKPLIVGEGFESVASLCRITGYPGIAALSANNLAEIVPPDCKEIIIAADNDEAGRKAARKATAKWLRRGRIIRIAIPERDGEDWNDVLCGLRSDDEWEECARGIDNLEPEDFDSYEVPALGMEQFMDLDFPPRQSLLSPWLTTTGLAMLDAEPGHGKTWLALSIAYAVASGTPLMDWTVEAKARVLYVDGELPGKLLQSRLRTLGAPLSDTQFKVLSRAQFELSGASMLDLGTPEGRELLDGIIERDQIDLVILDSVSTLVRSGVDNDAESWRAIQDWSLKHRARGRAVLYLHHQGRSGKPRGTSLREVVLDSRIKLTLDPDSSTEDKTAFKLEFPKSREFYGAEAAPKAVYLSTRSGEVEWSYEALKDSIRTQVQKLSQQGVQPSVIAKRLNISPGYVSQIRKAIKLSQIAGRMNVEEAEEIESL